MVYAFRKLLSFIFTLFIISAMTFFVFQLLPGDPARVILGTEADPLQVEALRQELGLNLPLAQRYIDWILGVFKGDLGMSLRFRLPVGAMLLTSLPVTASLSVLTLVITAVLVVPLSLLLTRLDQRPVGVLLSALIQLGTAVPSFWMGILLILVFSVTLNALPSGDFTPFSESISGALRSLILPSLALASGSVAIVTRYLKSALLDQMSQDYVRTAVGKGLTKRQAVFRHVTRNALLPAVTMLGMVFIDILGGSIIVENVFNLPGIGSLLILGVTYRDFPLVQGLTFYMACMVLIINTAVDLLYIVIDPRLRKVGLKGREA
ncbi:MAG: ABC transporter permease [Clostridiales bacterium]|jgi:peptide/nickel transport system permease protein|nr:ABC transporter permease [Clostridiales bacterium]